MKIADKFFYTQEMFMKDLDRCCLLCQERYKTEIVNVCDWIYIFMEEMTKIFKKYDIWKPLEQMKLYGIKDENGNINYSKWKYINLWYDPNFYDKCTSVGMHTDGFSVKFKGFDGRIISIRYFYNDNYFFIDMKEEDKENIS